MLQAHIIRLRGHSMFANSKIIFIPENMTGLTHTQLESAIGNFENVETLHQNGNIKAGISKNDYITRSYTFHTNILLQHGLFYLWKDWISVSAIYVFTSTNDARGALLKRYADQLLRFAYDENMKLHGKHNGEQDDGAIAVLMFGYWPQVVISSKTIDYYQNIVHGCL